MRHRPQSPPLSPQPCGSEAGSYLRLIDFCVSLNYMLESNNEGGEDDEAWPKELSSFSSFILPMHPRVWVSGCRVYRGTSLSRKITPP